MNVNQLNSKCTETLNFQIIQIDESLYKKVKCSANYFIFKFEQDLHKIFFVDDIGNTLILNINVKLLPPDHHYFDNPIKMLIHIVYKLVSECGSLKSSDVLFHEDSFYFGAYSDFPSQYKIISFISHVSNAVKKQKISFEQCDDNLSVYTQNGTQLPINGPLKNDLSMFVFSYISKFNVVPKSESNCLLIFSKLNCIDVISKLDYDLMIHSKEKDFQIFYIRKSDKKCIKFEEEPTCYILPIDDDDLRIKRVLSSIFNYRCDVCLEEKFEKCDYVFSRCYHTNICNNCIENLENRNECPKCRCNGKFEKLFN